jgi:receptor protein-tyrosine kinase
MSLIEQAAKRLEELRRAGADAGPEAEVPTDPVSARNRDTTQISTPEAAVRELANRGNVHVARGTRPDPLSVQHTHAPSPEGRSTEPRLQIDLNSLRSRGFVTLDMARSQLADEFRIVKRPIMRNAFGNARVKNGHLVMVASALPGEGKTYTAVNLAMSLAMELDTTVVLVDGDVAHPDLPNILGVRNSPGLLELLTQDDLDLEDVLVRTNIENLSILPAGAHQPRATELLASDQMGVVLRDLSTRFPERIIVFDSPPLLPTTEARVLATHMGQILMVVAADSTRQHTVEHALEAIASCEVVLMLLNKADKTDVGSYYGYNGNDGPR